MYHTPIVLIVFNRPQTTRQVFDVVAGIRPAKLLIVSDGPRTGNTRDAELCGQVQNIVHRINWPCEIEENISEVNLGCQQRVVSGLDWAFSLVEEAVILEDDCLPDPSFFQFCAELLARYRGDSRVATISGTNFLANKFRLDDSYYFSRLGGLWGWATWRTEWGRYDRRLETWPANRRDGTLQEIFTESRTASHWTRIFDEMHDPRKSSTWDYQWLYTQLINNSAVIVPRVNLVTNIGFGPDSTHTQDVDSRLIVPSRSMTFPLAHPQGIVPLRSMDRKLQILYSLPIRQRVVRKVRRVMNRMIGRA